jgi:ribonuclease BN (tRNA processing enzyme)
MRCIGLNLALLLGSLAIQVPAEAASGSHWLTLGTQGGPIPLKDRSQPANLLITNDGTYLVDAGDGVSEQLAKVGVGLGEVKAVLLSHLHFDHTAGLFGLLSLRWQTSVTAPLAIYGPPGTKHLVEGMISSMQPAVSAGYAYPGEARRPFGAEITVIEIRDGAHFELGATRVIAAKNTHYSFEPGSAEDHEFESLSFRFDTPGRSIAYTGDTGPSRAVERLAMSVDLLVTEMIDYDRTVDDIHRSRPNLAPTMLAGVEFHLREHHLTPVEVGKLAEAAKVKSVVVTHFAGPGVDEGIELEYLREIGSHFTGPVIIARDLDEF